MSAYWFYMLRYLTWVLLVITPAIFAPRNLPRIVVLLVAFGWTIAAMFVAGRLWSALAASFGWELPVEDDETN